MATRRYTDEFLLNYSGEHLKYEIDMFFRIAELLTRPFAMGMICSDFNPVMTRHAALEAFVIHLRNLIDFIYLDPQPDPGEQKARDTDVVAADFCANWKVKRGKISPTLAAANRRADKELAHLTTERKPGSSKDKEWRVEDLRDEIKPLLELFVKHANPNALSPDVAVAIRPTPQLEGPAGPQPYGFDMLVKTAVTGPVSTSARPTIPKVK
jgi:hypothetical protein